MYIIDDVVQHQFSRTSNAVSIPDVGVGQPHYYYHHTLSNVSSICPTDMQGMWAGLLSRFNVLSLLSLGLIGMACLQVAASNSYYWMH